MHELSSANTISDCKRAPMNIIFQVWVNVCARTLFNSILYRRNIVQSAFFFAVLRYTANSDSSCVCFFVQFLAGALFFNSSKYTLIFGQYICNCCFIIFLFCVLFWLSLSLISSRHFFCTGFSIGTTDAATAAVVALLNCFV